MLVEQGTDNVALWATDVGNSWRTTHDIRDGWQSMINIIDFVSKSFEYIHWIDLFFFSRTMNGLIKLVLVVGTIRIVSEQSSSLLFDHNHK